MKRHHDVHVRRRLEVFGGIDGVRLGCRRHVTLTQQRATRGLAGFLARGVVVARERTHARREHFSLIVRRRCSFPAASGEREHAEYKGKY